MLTSSRLRLFASQWFQSSMKNGANLRATVKGRHHLVRPQLRLEELENRITPANFKIVSPLISPRDITLSPQFAKIDTNGIVDSGPTYIEYDVESEINVTTSGSLPIGTEETGEFTISGNLVVQIIPTDEPQDSKAPVHVYFGANGLLSEYSIFGSDPSNHQPNFSISSTLQAGLVGKDAWFNVPGSLESKQYPSGHTEFDAHIGDTFTIAISSHGFDRDYTVGDVSNINLISGIYSQLKISMYAYHLQNNNVISNVTAQVGDHANGKDFGTYLSGVKLANTFTVQFNDPNSKVTTFDFSIDGLTTMSKPRPTGASASTITFTVPDMGVLGKGSHTLKVTAHSAAGDEDYPANVLVIDKLHPQISGKVGGSSNAIAIKDLRLLYYSTSTAPNTDYTVTIPDLPLVDAYKDLLSISKMNLKTDSTGPGLILVWQSGNTFALTNDPTLPDVVTNDETDADYEFEIVPRKPSFNNAVLTDVTSKDYQLRVVNLPSWMGTVTPTFGISPGGDKVFNGTGVSAYQMTFDFPEGLHYDLPPTFKIPFGLKDLDLSSFIGMGLNITVYAKPTYAAGDVKFGINNWFAKVQILGQSLINKSFTDSSLKIEGDLDPTTLKEAKEISISPAKAPIHLLDLLTSKPQIDLFFAKPDGTPWSIKVPFFKGGIVDASAKLSLSGSFHGELSKLDLDGKLVLDTKGTIPALAKSGSFISLETELKANAELKAAAALNVDFIGGLFSKDIIEASVTGRVNLDLNSKLKLDVGWNKGLNIDFNKKESYAELQVGYNIDYDFVTMFDKAPPEEKSKPGNNPKDLPKFKYVTLPLFGLPARKDGDDALKHFTGKVLYDQDGYQDLGDGTGPDPDEGPKSLKPFFVSEAAAGSQTVSTTTQQQPVFDNLQRIQADYTVKADRATLTPGLHFLDTLLIDEDGVETVLDSRDLASDPLQPADNFLGYAGPLSSIDISNAASMMQPGKLYYLQYRFRTDPGADGERVVVAVRNQQVTERQPALIFSSTGDDVDDEILTFGTQPTNSVTLTNTTDRPLTVKTLSIYGNGFTLVNPPVNGFVIPIGGSQTVQVKATGAKTQGGELRVETDDPTDPRFALGLNPSPLPSQPAIDKVVYALGQNQRSKFIYIQVFFNSLVTIQKGAFQLFLNDKPFPVSGFFTTIVDGKTVATVQMPTKSLPGVSLPDGRYRLVTRRGLVQNQQHQVMSQDGTDSFFRLFGDVNGDGKVDNTDLAVFNAAYGKGSNQAGYLSYLDFDNNGRIDAIDKRAFSARYGKQV